MSKILEDLVKDLDQEDRKNLVGILKTSINKEEIETLKTQLDQAGSDIALRIAIKDKLNKVLNS